MVRRQDPLVLRAELVADDYGGGIAREHLGAVEHVGAGAGEGVAVEVVRRHVVAIRPHAELRIVGEVAARRVHAERVAVVGAGGVATRRNRHALVERRDRVAGPGVEGELGEQPPVRRPVVEDNRIAVVGRVAQAAEARPQSVAGRGAVPRRSLLVPDLEGKVHPLDVVVWSDVAVGVRRNHRVQVAQALPGRAGRSRCAGGDEGLASPVLRGERDLAERAVRAQRRERLARSRHQPHAMPDLPTRGHRGLFRRAKSPAGHIRLDMFCPTILHPTRRQRQ